MFLSIEQKEEIKKFLCYNSNHNIREDYRMTCMMGFIKEDCVIIGSDSLITNVTTEIKDGKVIDTPSFTKGKKLFAGNERIVGIYGQTVFKDNDICKFVKEIIDKEDIKQDLMEYYNSVKEFARFGFGCIVAEKKDSLKMYEICSKINLAYCDTEMPKWEVLEREFSLQNPCFSIGNIKVLNKEISANMNPEIMKDILNLEMKVNQYTPNKDIASPPIQMFKLNIDGSIDDFCEADI